MGYKSVCGADTVVANDSRVSTRTPVTALAPESAQLGVVSAGCVSTVSAQPLARNHLNYALNRHLTRVAAHLRVVAAAAFAEATAGSANTQTRQLHGLKALEPERRRDNTVLTTAPLAQLGASGAVVARHATPEASRGEDVAETVEEISVRTHIRPADPGSDTIH